MKARHAFKERDVGIYVCDCGVHLNAQAALDSCPLALFDQIVEGFRGLGFKVWDATPPKSPFPDQIVRDVYFYQEATMREEWFGLHLWLGRGEQVMSVGIRSEGGYVDRAAVVPLPENEEKT